MTRSQGAISIPACNFSKKDFTRQGLQEVENEELNRDDNVLYIIDNDGTNCACVEFQMRNCGNVTALTTFTLSTYGGYKYDY